MDEMEVSISVIIPAVNEADNITRQVNFFKTYGYDKVIEIIVIDGDSEDDTALLAEKAGAKVIRSAIRSRAAQMNAGAKIAKGNILYFVHADTKIVESFIEDIRQSFQSNYDAGCYRYQFDADSKLLKLNAWFTQFDFLMFRGGDQSLFIKKEVFQQLNGFDETFVIMEEYEFLIRLRKQFKFQIIQKNIVVSARKYEHNSWLKVQLANAIAFTMFRLKYKPEKIKNFYNRFLKYRYNQ